MRVLIDMNLSPAWAGFLREAGIEALHWSNAGKPDASDHELMQWADDHGYTVMTNDLDFSAILAATSAGRFGICRYHADQDSCSADRALIGVNVHRPFERETHRGRCALASHPSRPG